MLIISCLNMAGMRMHQPSKRRWLMSCFLQEFNASRFVRGTAKRDKSCFSGCKHFPFAGALFFLRRGFDFPDFRCRLYGPFENFTIPQGVKGYGWRGFSLSAFFWGSPGRPPPKKRRSGRISRHDIRLHDLHHLRSCSQHSKNPPGSFFASSTVSDKKS